MKRMIGLALTACLLTAGGAFAQGTDRAAVEKQLIANERAVNEAFARNDVKAFYTYVAKDGVGVDAMGVIPASEFEKMIPQVRISTWNMDQTRVLWVTPSAAILTYRWSGQGTIAGQAIPSPMYQSSLWVNRDGRWVSPFAQATPAAPPAKPRPH